MRELKLAGIFALALLACAAYAGPAALVEFDRGGGAILPAAANGGVPPAPAPALAAATQDKPVWISVADGDIEALSGEFDFRELKRLARGPEASVYQVNTSDLDSLAGIMHRKLHKCGGFFTSSSLEAARSVVAPAPPAAPAAYTIDQRGRVSAMLALADENELAATISSLSAYKTRYYASQTGADAAEWLRAYWGRLAAGRDDITVEAYRHADWAQESVILTVRGASEPDKVVVLGGHLDSISRAGPAADAPGADDNASGIAALTEAIRVLTVSGYRPSKTVKFIGYAAEEVGLRGSQDIAGAFRRAGTRVEGVIQFDMTNFNGSPEDIFLITDNTDAAQNSFLGSLVKTYTDYRLGETRCGYACSDHASWTKNGYAASFPFEASFAKTNPAIHSDKDTLARSGGRALHALKFAKLAVAYLVETAK